MLKTTLLGAIAICTLTLPAAAQEAYVVGLTGALTGPPSSTYAPAVDALRIYIDRVNAAGGVNGKKIQLILEDDGAQPSKAAANTKKLISQDNAVLVVNASLSSTYAPMIAETKAAGVPLLFSSGVCPQSVSPPADPLQFCSTGFAYHFDSRATLDQVKEMATGPVRIGFAAMAIPFSRREMDFAQYLEDAGDDPGGRAGHSAGDRRLHPFRHQAQGCGTKLGLLLGAVGHSGPHIRGAEATRLAG